VAGVAGSQGPRPHASPREGRSACRRSTWTLEGMSDSGPSIDDTDAFPGPQDTLLLGARTASIPSCPPSSGQAWYDYTTGYKEAADLLVAHIEATGRRADKLGYPILFVYRQHLELVVKNLIRVCGHVLGQKQDFPKHHRLGELWEICKRLLLEISPGASPGDIQETTRLFRELHTVDPNADAFRFPEDTRANVSLVSSGDVNLSSVRDIVEKMSFFLDCIEASITEG
jgi:hypothetical protein